MIVGTTQAAKILNISTARLRSLLIAGRVEGAYKTGKMWLTPLFNGKPIIRRGKRGPAPRWRNPRKPAKTISLGARSLAACEAAGSHRCSRQLPKNSTELQQTGTTTCNHCQEAPQLW